MRYDELTLMLGDSELHVRFHPHLTVIAGLSGRQRHDLLDEIVQLTRGVRRGGSVTLIDESGRRTTLDGASSGGMGDPQRHTGQQWRTLLTVEADRFDLPRARDDPQRISLQEELDSERRRAGALRSELDAVRDQRRRHAAVCDELRMCEAQLAELGTAIERFRHTRARLLVEGEQVRASLEAVDAPPAQIRRDDRLIEATSEIEMLATEWAALTEERNRLQDQIGDHPWLDPSRVSELTRIPAEVPENLTMAIAEITGLRTAKSTAQVALQDTLDASSPPVPADSRVLTLAALDQDSLWLTHRNVLLAAEALADAEREAAAHTTAEPDQREHLEEVHAAAVEAATVADKRWLPTVLVTTIALSVAAMLVILDVWRVAPPVLTIAAIAWLIRGVAVPALQARRTRRAEAAALHTVGATNISEYRARFSDDPNSGRWQRAERLIADYGAANDEWQALVGAISPSDASGLEDAVQTWIVQSDRDAHDRQVTRIRREIKTLSEQIAAASQRLRTLLEPYGLDPHTPELEARLDERVCAGCAARLLRAIEDLDETEAKITRRLDAELVALGFETGDLASRISAFGRELDAAQRRVKLRRDAPERDELAARAADLRRRLAVPGPGTEGCGPGVAAGDKRLDALRERRAQLRQRVDAFVDPDTREAERSLDGVERHIGELEAALTPEPDPAASGLVDDLVETLVRYRPPWPTTEQDPTPAFLDDPFAAVEADPKRQLLAALVEVSRLVQVILLTGDAETTAWARAAQDRGVATLIAPIEAAA